MTMGIKRRLMEKIPVGFQLSAVMSATASSSCRVRANARLQEVVAGCTVMVRRQVSNCSVAWCALWLCQPSVPAVVAAGSRSTMCQTTSVCCLLQEILEVEQVTEESQGLSLTAENVDQVRHCTAEA
jgi:hypothetical protein